MQRDEFVFAGRNNGTVMRYADAVDTFAAADSAIILDAPLWHHWPSGAN